MLTPNPGSFRITSYHILRYGPVVRIGPNELNTLTGVNGAYPKSASYSVVRGSRPFGLAGERNEKVHSAQRKPVAMAYSMESTLRLEPQIDELFTLLLNTLDAVTISKQTIDIGYWLQLFAFDVVGAVSFSKPYGFVSSGSDSYGSDKNFFARLASSLHSATWLMHAGWLFQLHQKFIMPLVSNLLAVNERNGFFFHFAQCEVQTRREQGGNDKDIVGQLFQMMTSNVFAGSDTTSIALRANFLNLMSHPHALAKLRAELQGQQTAGKLSTIVTAVETDLCPYLQAVIYESMRLFSPVAFIFDQDVTAEGMTIGGHHVPGGTVVGTSPWVIHRATKVWGDDVEEFRPERWLDREDSGMLSTSKSTYITRERTVLLFQALVTLVPTLVMRYDFNLAEDATITENCGALVFLKGLRVQVTRLLD
ncbi:cytochrome P450 [Xylaria acuta]|nr:cytochrome P450 [Xylaria acuta]